LGLRHKINPSIHSKPHRVQPSALSMKSIRIEQFGPSSVLQAAVGPALSAGPGQIRVALKAIGVNPVDTYIRSGGYAFKPELPYTPGSDGAGIVVELGPGVSGFSTGQRVYLTGSLTGTYAEEALCEPKHLHPLPDHISFEQGAALGIPYATAFYALYFRARAVPGETVLIHGASGGVGLAAVQIARSMGLRVFGTGGSDSGREEILRQGAHVAFNHTQTGYEAEITAQTDGLGLDVVVEMLANVNLDRDLKLLAPNGRVVVIGSRGPVEIHPRDAMIRNAEIRGVLLAGATEKELASIHAALYAGLEAGVLRPVIGRRFALIEAAAAHDAVLTPGALGKIILVP
jgi:NADPH2:quinone reductase